MARLFVFEAFLDARNNVRSERIRKNIDDMLRTIEDMPGVGPFILPKSIVHKFGPGVRKAVVSPFEIVYEHNEEVDTVFVYALLYCPGFV